MKLRARIVAGWFGAFLLAATPVFARAADVGAEATDPEASSSERDVSAATDEAVEEDAGGETGPGVDLDAYWGRRLERASQRLALARERAEKAEAEYSRARHDRDPRGGSLEAVKERHFVAERELREAEAALPRLAELARRAGVTPGTIRTYWDEDEAPDGDETS